MQFIVKQPVNDGTQVIFKQIETKDIQVGQYSLMAIDGATGNSGIAIVRESDGALLYLIDATRETKTESPVRYKIMLKKEIVNILRDNHFIHEIYYEQPVVGHISAVSNLFMLRAFVEEMIIENEPDLNYIGNFEVANTHWKKLFIGDETLPSNTDLQKEIVRKKMLTYLPIMSTCTQDTIDAYALGFVAAINKQKGLDGKDLATKKKARPFKFRAIFAGAEDDEMLLNEFSDIYTGPEKLIGNGISFVSINKREDFDKAVYNNMGDEDMILIIRFDSSSHCNIVLENNIGSLAAQYPYIYAIVWRANRK